MRLIDADKISYERAHLIYPDGSECLGYRAVASSAEINAAPTVDAVEVVHGRWDIDEFGHYCTACREYGPEIECDEETVDLLKYGTPYCPNCGANMDGDGNG